MRLLVSEYGLSTEETVTALSKQTADSKTKIHLSPSIVRNSFVLRSGDFFLVWEFLWPFFVFCRVFLLVSGGFFPSFKGHLERKYQISLYMQGTGKNRRTCRAAEVTSQNLQDKKKKTREN